MHCITPGPGLAMASRASGANQAAVVEALRGLAIMKPVQKMMLVRIGHSPKPRKLTWYDPCETAALDTMIRAGCGISPKQNYLLLDRTMSAVAVSSSLPTGEEYELVCPAAATAPAVRSAAVHAHIMKVGCTATTRAFHSAADRAHMMRIDRAARPCAGYARASTWQGG